MKSTGTNNVHNTPANYPIVSSLPENNIAALENDYIQSRITTSDRVINRLKKFIRIINRKINVFTEDVQKMQGNKYLRCGFNKNIKLFRGSIVNEQNISGQQFIHNDNIYYSSHDLLSSNYVENLAKSHVNKIYTTFKNGDVIKMDIPIYASSIYSNSDIAKKFISEYIKTFDMCMRFQKKTSENNKIITVKFGFPDIYDAETLNPILNDLLKEINNDNVHSFAQNTHEFMSGEINFLTENKSTQDAKQLDTVSDDDIPITTSVEQNPSLDSSHNDESVTTDKKIEKNSLNFFEDIDRMRREIAHKMNDITIKQILNEILLMEKELDNNKVEIESAFFVRGDITNIQSLGLVQNVAVMNYTNTKDEEAPLKLTLGEAMAIDSEKGLKEKGINTIIQTTAPELNGKDGYLKSKNDIIMACLVNSYIESIKATKAEGCDSLVAVLAETDIYGIKQEDCMIAFMIALKIVKREFKFLDTNIYMLHDIKINDKRESSIAKLRIIEKMLKTKS